MEEDLVQFDEESWALLPDFFAHLPERVLIAIWGDEDASTLEKEAIRLANRLSRHFAAIEYQLLPRQPNFQYYPVLGIMRLSDEEPVDDGVRIIGLPLGFQITSLIAAVQCVSFRGSTAEAKTRIRLRSLVQPVALELFTAAHDELGPAMAQAIFNMAVNSEYVRSFLIMSDAFPQAALRYSVTDLPHLVINRNVHVQGIADEDIILDQIAKAVKG